MNGKMLVLASAIAITLGAGLPEQHRRIEQRNRNVAGGTPVERMAGPGRHS